ncbi:MAG: phage major capsid protein [Hydrogenophaga sp.]|uniref:phage major capsid protein n=1 Tax=Hydrogenophaga sp. TaxID=1904254 RepID=UPI004035C890
MSAQALRERLASLKKEARNLLEEKGSSTWTAEDKTKFDNFVDEAERVEQQIDAHQRLLDNRAEETFENLPRNEGKGKKTDAQRGVEIFLRKMTKELTQEEALLIRNAMSTTTGSEGGHTVQPVVASPLIETMKDYGGIRRVASQITTEKGGELSYPSSDGTAEEGEIVAQNVPANAADMTFGTVPLNTFKFGSRVIAIPIELLQDTSIDILALVYGRVRDRIGRIQNRMMTRDGTGTGSPFALVSAAGVGKVGTTGQTTSVIYDDLVDLTDSIDPAYMNDQLLFMFNQVMRRTIRKIKDTSGRPIWTPSYEAGATAKTPDLLLGYPVELNNHMPTPAANAKSISFGDHSKYMVRDAMEVTLFRFEDSAFLTKGQVGFLAWSRAGGNLLDAQAVKTYQHPAT